MCSNLSSQSKHSLLHLSLLPSLVSALLLPLLSRQTSFIMESLPEKFSTYNDQQKQNYIYIYVYFIEFDTNQFKHGITKNMFFSACVTFPS